jgi:hypothetical protein
MTLFLYRTSAMIYHLVVGVVKIVLKVLIDDKNVLEERQN